MCQVFLAVLIVMSAAALGRADAASRPAAGEALAYPVKPIRFVVGFPPGGGNDALTRIISPKLSDAFDKPVVIDNRPGAGGNLAAELVAKSPSDGYTILMISSSHPIAGLLKKGLPYDPIRDFDGIAQLVTYRSLLVVYPGFPAPTVQGLIALARSKPAQLNFISSGNGTGSHLAGELFRVMARVDMTHVAYKGGAQALVDLVAGRVEMMFSPLVPVLAHLKSGRLKPVAVTSLNRSRLLPELPTVSDAGVPGYEFVSWYGVLAPAHTPKDVIAKLNAAMNATMRQSDVTERVHSEDMDVIDRTPQQFDQVRKDMIVKWSRIIKQTGIEAN